MPSPKSANRYTALKYDIIALINLSWKAFVLNWVTWAKFFAAVIALAILLFVPLFAASGIIQDSSGEGAPLFYIASAVIAAFTVLTVWLFGLFTTVSTWLMLDSVYGKKVGLRELTKRSVKDSWRMVGLSIVFLILVIIGFILLIVPGVILANRLSFSFYILLTEGASISDSLRRSWRMTDQEFWMIFIMYAIQQAPGSISNILPPVGPAVSFAVTLPLLNLHTLWYMVVKEDRPPVAVATGEAHVS